MILNMTQHTATFEQISEGVVDPSDENRIRIQELLTFNGLPTRQELINRAELLTEIAVQILKVQDFKEIMIGGAPFFMPILAKKLDDVGFDPVYAFSTRKVVEQTQQDGSVRKVAEFRHEGFVPHIF